MLQCERYEKIEEIVNKLGFVNTKELAETLNVTEKTIRLDYEALEKMGRLIRVHGGAKSVKSKIVTPMNEKWMKDRMEHTWQKDVVAKRAAELVHEDACIFLDGGTSVAAMVQYLKGKRIKIVTNSQLVVNELENDTAELYVIGGSYIPKYAMTVGPFAMEQVIQFHFDYAFISCLGADVERNMVYTAEIETMAVKRAAMKNAASKILLLDSSKLSIQGFCGLASMEDFNMVICNRDMDMKEESLPENIILEGKQ